MEQVDSNVTLPKYVCWTSFSNVWYIFLFMLLDYARNSGTNQKFLVRRLQLIMNSCILDDLLYVGYGGGVIVPYLIKSYSSLNCNIQHKHSMSSKGLCLLSEMIYMDKKSFPEITLSNFIKKGFPNDTPSLITNRKNTFKTILFNSSMIYTKLWDKQQECLVLMGR